jgi:murein L,D-transpeptidase YcbB/YkuD
MRYQHAQWKGAHPNNFSTTRNVPKFIVIHVTSGDSLGGTDSWFQNPKAQVSAHFCIGKDGQVHQYVDTDQVAYAEMAWNDKSISIEHSGHSGDSLTPAQLASLKGLLTWINMNYKIPLVRTKNGHGFSGIIGHGELGVDGGNHPNCPGKNILKSVETLLGETPPSVPAPTPAKRQVIKLGSTGLDVIYLQQKLHIPADGQFGPQTDTAVRHFQAQHSLSVDGVVGPKTWAKIG